MDDTHLAHPVGWIARLARAPALHFALLGALLFVTVGRGSPSTGERPRVEVPAYLVEEMRREAVDAHGRPLQPDEERRLVRLVADEALLFHYAKSLGLNESDAARRRLAQVASFVSENPHEAPAQAEWMNEVESIGLDYGDRVLRAMLADAARRLLRAPALVAEPREERLREYFQAHAESFALPARMRLSHVTFAHAGRRDPRADAAALLADLRGRDVSSEAATRFGDRIAVEPRLPALVEEDLVRRFDVRFVRALADSRSARGTGRSDPATAGTWFTWTSGRRRGFPPSRRCATRCGTSCVSAWRTNGWSCACATCESSTTSWWTVGFCATRRVPSGVRAPHRMAPGVAGDPRRGGGARLRSGAAGAS